MRVYLAPFLHGSRYTSFGRHFTQPDKLRQVVERLLPYIDDEDVVSVHRLSVCLLLCIFALKIIRERVSESDFQEYQGQTSRSVLYESHWIG
jgi:hypothetical protein